MTNVCEDALDFMRKMSEEADKNASQSDEKLPEEITSSPYYLGEEKGISKPSALILDPPRKGCDKDVLEGAKKANFAKIVYVSCNPQTLARDLKILSQSYDVERVTPFDMFPQTSNVEVMCVLQRK